MGSAGGTDMYQRPRKISTTAPYCLTAVVAISPAGAGFEPLFCGVVSVIVEIFSKNRL